MVLTYATNRTSEFAFEKKIKKICLSAEAVQLNYR